MRGRNLVKFITALELLGRAQGVTIIELAEALKVNRRSVYRQLQLLESLNVPIYEDKGTLDRKKRWKLVDTYVKRLPNLSLPDVRLTFPELISLYLLKCEAKVYRGTQIEKNLTAAFLKIGMFLPDQLSDKLGKIKSLFLPNVKFAKDYSGKEDLIDILIEAIFQRKTCHVKYHSFGGDTKKEYDIDPLKFFEQNGGLYLFARVKKYNDIRIFAVERFLKIVLSEKIFLYPKKFNPEKVLGCAFGVVYDDPLYVRIWFSANQAKYVMERSVSKNQKIIQNRDGSIVLEMNTSGFEDVKRWVLSFGKEALVLKPKKLKEAVISELQSMEQLYR